MDASDYRCAISLLQAPGASQCEAGGRSVCGMRGRLRRPDGLEGAEAELAVVVETRVVDPAHVVVVVLRDECVVRLGRLPAVDHEVAAGRLDVAEEFGADVAAALPEELRPLAVRPVD